MKSITPELINSLTPIFIAMIGGIIGVTVIIKEPADKWAAGFGLAGTAIAGAAGLAQSSKHESTVSEQNSNPAIQNNEAKQTSS